MHSAVISISKQDLMIFNDLNDLIFSCAVNTAKNGVGCQQDSGCTPIGLHYVRACIGDGLPANAVLKARRATGELWNEPLALHYPERDWILGRILWLCGLEKGLNRGGNVDTFRRFIYIHASPHWPIGAAPASHGCVRIQPEDMVRVFDLLPYASQVRVEL